MAPPILQTDPVLCHCFKVSESTVDHCLDSGATNVREVREACGAGGGCMGCRRRIQCYIEQRGQALQIANEGTLS